MLSDTCLTIANSPKPVDYRIPHIKLRFDGNNEANPVALNTGATINAVSYAWWLNNRKSLPHRPSRAPIQVANGQNMKPWGTAVVKTQLNGKWRPLEVQIIKDFAFDVLLGSPQLKRWRWTYDSTKNEVQIADQHFTVLTATKAAIPTKSPVKPLVAKTTMILPGQSSLIVNAQVEGYEPKTTGIAISDPNILNQASLFVGKGIPQINADGECRLLLANMSTEDVRVPKGTQIGSLAVSDPSDYTTIPCERLLSLNTDDSAEQLVAEILSNESQQPIEGLDLEGSVLGTDDKTKLNKVLRHFKDRFVLNNQRPSQTSLVKISIDTGDADPVNQAPYRRAPPEKAFIENTIKETRQVELFRNPFLHGLAQLSSYGKRMDTSVSLSTIEN